MRFKKGTALLLAFFLLLSSSGFAFSAHFCEGKLASISASYKTEETCGKKEKKSDDKCCGTPTDDHKKCCSDKKVELKKKAPEVVTKTFSLEIDHAINTFDWKPLVFEFQPEVVFEQKNDYCCDANAPPLFKLYSQYIFYA